MRFIPIFVLLFILAGCSQTMPTDAELRLAGSSELRKLKRPEAEQLAAQKGDITNIQCQGTNETNVCSFSIGGKPFKKTFSKTGSGGWSAYER